MFSLFNSRIENEVEEPLKEDEDKENKDQNLEKKPLGRPKKEKKRKAKVF